MLLQWDTGTEGAKRIRARGKEFHKEQVLRVRKDRRERLGKPAESKLGRGWKNSLDFEVMWLLISFE